MTANDELLTGTVTGKNRAELIERALDLARTYYATECVDATLHDATTETTHHTVRYGNEPVRTISTYTANFAAAIAHAFPVLNELDEHGNLKLTGTVTCTRCGQTTDAMLLNNP